MTAGYSGMPLAKKLGIKPGHITAVINPPAEYFSLFEGGVFPALISKDASEKKDFIHFFCSTKHELTSRLPELKTQIVPHGMIWVSWPKKSSKLPCDFTENDVRDLALQTGLVDIKVCAVDENWSGLKLVIPVKDRSK